MCLCVLCVTSYLFSPNKDPQDPPSNTLLSTHMNNRKHTRRPRVPSCGGCRPNSDAMQSGRGGVCIPLSSDTHTHAGLSCSDRVELKEHGVTWVVASE